MALWNHGGRNLNGFLLLFGEGLLGLLLGQRQLLHLLCFVEAFPRFAHTELWKEHISRSFSILARRSASLSAGCTSTGFYFDVDVAEDFLYRL